jgi:hypothetical protein
MAPAETEPDAYEILGLTIEATEKEIKSTYRKLSLKVHPDRVCCMFCFASLFAATQYSLSSTPTILRLLQSSMN